MYSFYKQGRVRGTAGAPPRASGSRRGGGAAPPPDGPRRRISYISLLGGKVFSDLNQTWGNSCYKPPRASYKAQGPQKQPEIIKKQTLHAIYKFQRFPYISCIFHFNAFIWTIVPLKALYSPSDAFRGVACFQLPVASVWVLYNL